MSPDVVTAIARLRAEGVLSPAQAALFDRVARRQLVSVRFEIRALLYAGVLLVVGGVGVLVVEHLQDIGPVAIAIGIAVAAGGCLAWVARHAAPFSWSEVSSPNVALDYVLLLGLLLFASGLAVVEAQFTLLGPRWPTHLLVAGLVYLVAAYRFDSRTTLALALTTLATWAGVSLRLAPLVFGSPVARDLRASAIGLGALYLGAAALSVRLGRKAHFETVYATTGLVLLLGALLAGTLDDKPGWGAWLLALLAVSAGVMALAFRLGRPLYFALALLVAYVGAVRLLFAPLGQARIAFSVRLLLAALLGAAVVVLVSRVHRRMRDR